VIELNLFKVMASGKKSFLEEQASAIISWFMNPRMEHGLGFLFLSRFVNELQTCEPGLSDIAGKLINQLRSDSDKELKWSCKLEYNVLDAFVDIVFYLDEWIIAIENKIYANSASDERQLVKEYEGLQKLNPGKNIGIIFLVPYTAQDGDLINPKIQTKYAALPDSLDGQNFKQLVTWQKNILGFPSISKIIESILMDEAKGLIEPIPEYTRHTLKALNVFINSEFEGYYYDGSTRYSGNNENTEENLTISELAKRPSGFVGVQNGLSGLMQMDKEKLQKRSFQFTSIDMTTRNNWLSLDVFNKITEWLITGKEPDIIWETSLPSKMLYKIVKDCTNAKIFIGIKGGLKALEAMSYQEIQLKRWGIRTAESPPTNQWIEGSKFREVIEQKGVY
jgi:hypothetical protein